MGCLRKTPEPVTQVGTPVASETAAHPTFTPLPEPTTTQTSSPTATMTPSGTASPEPTHTATPSPTSEPLVGVINTDNTNILSGPATNYAFVGSFNAGFRVEIIGKSQAGNWLVVRISREQHGWVSRDHLDVDFLPDDLVVFEAPPVPDPTATPSPTPIITADLFEYWNLKYFCITTYNLNANQVYTIHVHYVTESGASAEDYNQISTTDDNGRIRGPCIEIGGGRGTATITVSSGIEVVAVYIYDVP